MRRGQQARRLLLLIREADEVNTMASALVQPKHTWANLRSLWISELCKTGDDGQLLCALLWLLGQAKMLQFLRLPRNKLLFLPPLAKLKHLQLSIQDSSRLGQSLTCLNSLQTLFLEYDFHGPAAVERPSLDLKGLSHLSSVALKNVVPESLVLPEGAALHLHLMRLSDLKKDIWQGHAPVLESVYVCDIDLSILDASQLPSILLKPNGLRRGSFSSCTALGQQNQSC